jgi:hypothetical protein
MPKQFHQIALSTTKAENFATMRIAPKTLLNRQRKGIRSIVARAHGQGISRRAGPRFRPWLQR